MLGLRLLGSVLHTKRPGYSSAETVRQDVLKTAAAPSEVVDCKCAQLQGDLGWKGHTQTKLKSSESCANYVEWRTYNLMQMSKLQDSVMGSLCTEMTAK